MTHFGNGYHNPVRQRRLWLLLAAILTAGCVEPVYADQPYKSIECDMKSIQATFKAALSSYQLHAVCWMIIGGGQPLRGYVLWNSQGSYDPQTRVAKEAVNLSTTPTYIPPTGGGAPFSATATTTLSCASDPWLGPSLGAGKAVCSHEDFQVSGQVMAANYWLDWLKNGFLYGDTGKRGFSLPNSTGFQYARAALIAQRDADLQAEAAQAKADAEAKAQADLNTRNSRLSKGAQPQPLIAPTIVAPAAGSLFLSNTSVPIKIAPPQGIAAAAYVVRLESKNAQGVWTPVTNLPMSATEASSPSGYLGWGAPGNGRGAAMIAGPGSYRISAQVSSPRPTGWSQSVEFVVTTPNKAIQKAPKMFGP